VRDQSDSPQLSGGLPQLPNAMISEAIIAGDTSSTLFTGKEKK